ncbi:MAG: hypothetical protein ACOCUD_01705 [Bacillota bacterium]
MKYWKKCLLIIAIVFLCVSYIKHVQAVPNDSGSIIEYNYPVNYSSGSSNCTCEDVYVNESGDTMTGDLDLGTNDLYFGAWLSGYDDGDRLLIWDNALWPYKDGSVKGLTDGDSLDLGTSGSYWEDGYFKGDVRVSRLCETDGTCYNVDDLNKTGGNENVNLTDYQSYILLNESSEYSASIYQKVESGGYLFFLECNSNFPDVSDDSIYLTSLINGSNAGSSGKVLNIDSDGGPTGCGVVTVDYPIWRDAEDGDAIDLIYQANSTEDYYKMKVYGKSYFENLEFSLLTNTLNVITPTANDGEDAQDVFNFNSGNGFDYSSSKSDGGGASLILGNGGGYADNAGDGGSFYIKTGDGGTPANYGGDGGNITFDMGIEGDGATLGNEGNFIIKNTNDGNVFRVQGEDIYIRGDQHFRTQDRLYFGSSDEAYIYQNGNTLYMNSDEVYVSGNFSAENVYDRSYHFEKEKMGSALDYLSNSEKLCPNGKCSDENLYEFEKVKVNITDKSRPEIIEKCRIVKFWDNKEKKEKEKKVCEYVTTYPYEKEVTMRSISVVIGKHEQALYEIKEENDLLKLELCNKNVVWKTCTKFFDADTCSTIQPYSFCKGVKE